MVETLPLHHLTRVSSLLARGEIVAYPTGTSYALGANALDDRSLQRLDELKQRPEEKTYSILLPDREPERWVQWTKEERRVYDRLRSRPLTLLVAAKAPLTTIARDGRVGIRTPDHPFARELVELLSFPITATSANVSGETPACALGDLERLAKDVRLYAVDGGSLSHCLPSTIAALDGNTWVISRKGDVTARELTAAAKEATE